MIYQFNHLSNLPLGKDLLVIVGGGWVGPRVRLQNFASAKFVGLTAYSLVTIPTELLHYVVPCFKIVINRRVNDYFFDRL
jgi:hypothetical protein